MNITFKNISNSLNKAYLKQDITKYEFDRFINSLEKFYQNHNPIESEEHQKNDIAEFLKSAFYKDSNLINTKNRIDLAIYNGTNINDTVGVLIEVKSTKNKSEMISLEKPNAKALQEAISYYLEESITQRNKDIKHIIICTPENWFIFDGAEFERAFYKNSTLIQNFTHHREELFGASTTDWFYNYLRDDIIPKIEEFSCTYINFSDYKHKINSPEYVDDLILLFKILSPEHLLKKPFANDSNTLDTQFYDELLHLLGLEEVKDSGKKVLLRLPESKRIDGSLLENTIRILDISNSLDRVANLNEFGANKDEQLFSIGLELCITWLNRILFLKLLESQLIKYNNNDYSYKFLSNEKISDFDELNELFFEVLAIKPKYRANQDKQRFAKIPYLNSSLFEQTKLEKDTIAISALKDRYTLPIYQKSVLKTLSGDKRTGELKFQEYLFEFLDAYNFASVSKASIQQTNKTIINSSVLGLIFEKLNGYKDGSYFTPGYITMYMCREAISLAVVNKFNQHYNWTCKTLTDIYNKLESNSEKYFEYNSLINSIRLVDPAVGSGHFLVSALNEFINIKAELGVLIDKNGKRLKDYKFYIENDELIIVDNDDNIFSYLSPEKVSGAKRDELQRIQETLFHEKQTIIENCLFGVDINPKSVSISRLRLWIELLKFMYYKKEDGNYELETLPNIDINIKSGNSLVSRFPVDENSSLSIADARIIPQYKIAVNNYKNAKNQIDKKNTLIEIENYKSQLRGMISDKANKVMKLGEKKEELKLLINQTELFGENKNKKEEKVFADKVKKISDEIHKLENYINDLDNNPIFHNALEWRFEFPEVLNDNGNFIGFDVVIGNPPYFSISTFDKNTKKYFENSSYRVYSNTSDIYTLFIEMGFNIISQIGISAQIISNKWMRANYGESLRFFLSQKVQPLKLIDFGGFKVFDSATVDTNIIISKQKEDFDELLYACTTPKDFDIKNSISDFFEKNKKVINEISKEPWIISSNNELKIKEKIESKGVPLKQWDININYGIKTALNEAFIISGEIKREILEKEPESSIFTKPILRGRDIKKYKAEFADLWLINIPKGYTIKTMQKVNEFKVSEPIPNYGYYEYDEAWAFFKSNFPVLAKYLINFKDKAEQRQDKGDYWWELRACAYLGEFEKEKIIYPNMTKYRPFVYDKNFYFTNQKCFIVTSNFENLMYLVSILNSWVFDFAFKDYFPELLGGTRELSKIFFEKVPIPKISPEEQQPFIDLVDKIIKKKELGDDTTAEEKQIDLMVYKLYELTYDEVKVVEPDFQMTEEEYERYGEK